MATLTAQDEAGKVGLRERKKARTCGHIADTAARLFAEHGFEAVSVVEVARAAEVSEATVYNYFPTKEDLVYQRLESFEAAMMEAVRSRPPGLSVLDAVRDFVLEPGGFLTVGEPSEVRTLMTVARVISGSSSLLAREREAFSRCSQSLALLIAAESGAPDGDLRPRVVANVLVGVHHALVDLVRRRLCEGVADRRQLIEEVRAQGSRSFALLARGLRDFGLGGSGGVDR